MLQGFFEIPPLTSLNRWWHLVHMIKGRKHDMPEFAADGGGYGPGATRAVALGMAQEIPLLP